MTAKQKIKYVKDRIAEVVDISPKGPVYLALYRVVENDGYTQPTLISIDEQKTILKKLEEDGYLKNVNEDSFTNDDGVWLEMAEKNSEPKKIRRSNLLSYIKTIDDLLRHRRPDHL